MPTCSLHVSSVALFVSTWFPCCCVTLPGSSLKSAKAVLLCYGFKKSWSLLDGLSSDGEARDPRPASGLSASSKLKREDQDEGRERTIFKLVSSFKQMEFSTPPAAKPIKLFVWGRASPRVTSWPCSRHLIFNLSRERYTGTDLLYVL